MNPNPFFAALAFLTKIPVPGPEKISQNLLGKSYAYFPAVGAIIGILLLLAANLLHYLFPFHVSLRAVLLLTWWVFLTGALHLDGLADTFDGIGGGTTISDRLCIMRDPHTGTFGMVALILLLLLKYNFLLNLETGVKLAPALFYSPLLSRWAMVVLLYTTPYSRAKEGQTGLVSPFMLNLNRRRLFIATASTLAAGIFYPRLFFLLLLPLTALVIVISRVFFLKKLGGITGDCLGAVNEVTELAVLFCLAIPLLPPL